MIPRIVPSCCNTLAVALLLGVLSCWAAPASTPAAAAQTYVTEGGWGALSFKAGRFELHAQGVNGHTCSLDGARKGDRGLAGEGCELRFKSQADGSLEVAAATEDMEQVCRMFCGMRASFDGRYFPTPTGCEPAQRQARRAQGQQSYKAGRHVDAASAWESLDLACGRFMYWSERYALRNDRAIAAYHVGDLMGCLELSKEAADDKALQQFKETAPSDHEALLPLYKAARHNMQRCRAAIKP